MNVYRTDEIRNVVLLGHGGSGKTSLVEAIQSVILIKKSRSANSQSARH